MSDALTKEDFEALRKIDTPTICNLLEFAAPERRGFGFTFHHLHCIFPGMKPIVGYAKTATVRARVQSKYSADEYMAIRTKYLGYVGEGDMPKVSIVQDLDETPGYGALWGEVQTAVHKCLGVEGVVTNGSVRDLDMIVPDFQLLAGVIAPSHAYVHICDFAGEVNVHGMTVNDGDLIHADRHGAALIPHKVAKELPGLLDLLVRREKVILDVTKKPGVTAAELAHAWRAASKIKSVVY